MKIEPQQQMFDVVARHLLTQNAKSDNKDLTVSRLSEDACLYRGPNGLQCAAGVLIPDELYCPEMEGREINAVIPDYNLEEHIPYVDLAMNLQRVHDGCIVAGWPVALQEVAHLHKLSPTVLEEFA